MTTLTVPLKALQALALPDCSVDGATGSRNFALLARQRAVYVRQLAGTGISSAGMLLLLLLLSKQNQFARRSIKEAE